MSSRAGRVVGTVALFLGSLLLAEGALQLLCARSRALDRLLTPRWAIPPTIPDALLGAHGNPRWPEHDAWGFRNAAVPARADAVILGDSQTYGTGVGPGEAWPGRVAVATRLAVYNMGFPGWGPGQEAAVIDRALTLRPRVVLYGVYFGNDLYDGFAFAARTPSARRFVPGALLDTAIAFEARAPMAQRFSALFSLAEPRPDSAAYRTGTSVRALVARHSRLYGLARAVASAVRQETEPPRARDLETALGRLNEAQRRIVQPARTSGWGTLLTPSYRNMVVDASDPRIAAGLAAMRGFLAELDERCRAHGVRFAVVLIPTKESVFAARLSTAERGAPLDSLVANEGADRDSLVAWLSGRGVPVLDVLPALQRASGQPYPGDTDGHPNPVGHQAIAGAVAGWLLTLLSGK